MATPIFAPMLWSGRICGESGCEGSDGVAVNSGIDEVEVVDECRLVGAEVDICRNDGEVEGFDIEALFLEEDAKVSDELAE